MIVPGHRDTRVQIVELGSAEGNLLVLFTIRRLHLQLHQLLLYPLNGLLLCLDGPTRDEHHKLFRTMVNVTDEAQTVDPHQILSYSLFGLLIFPYFGVSLGALQFSLGIRKLVPFSINLRGESDMPQTSTINSNTSTPP